MDAKPGIIKDINSSEGLNSSSPAKSAGIFRTGDGQ